MKLGYARTEGRRDTDGAGKDAGFTGRKTLIEKIRETINAGQRLVYSTVTASVAIAGCSGASLQDGSRDGGVGESTDLPAPSETADLASRRDMRRIKDLSTSPDDLVGSDDGLGTMGDMAVLDAAQDTGQGGMPDLVSTADFNNFTPDLYSDLAAPDLAVPDLVMPGRLIFSEGWADAKLDQIKWLTGAKGVTIDPMARTATVNGDICWSNNFLVARQSLDLANNTYRITVAVALADVMGTPDIEAQWGAVGMGFDPNTRFVVVGNQNQMNVGDPNLVNYASHYNTKMVTYTFIVGKGKAAVSDSRLGNYASVQPAQKINALTNFGVYVCPRGVVLGPVTIEQL